MLRIERILFPVDFSEFSTRAYDYAYSLARHYEAKLLIQHVADPLLSLYHGYLSQALIDEVYSHQTAYAEEQFRSLAARNDGKGIDSEFVMQRGLVADSILSLADAKNIDLIVMGTHGRRGFDRLVLGSIVERVLRKAACPVLAVRHPVRDFVNAENLEEPVHLRKVLFCTDFSDNSPQALEYAFSLAFQYNAEITLLHVLEPSSAPPDVEKEKEQVSKHLEDAVPAEARNWATVVLSVRTGKPYHEIVEHAAATQTDLIVMGVRGRHAVDIALFGSTTHRVIQLGPCPVLVVRT